MARHHNIIHTIYTAVLACTIYYYYFYYRLVFIIDGYFDWVRLVSFSIIKCVLCEIPSSATERLREVAADCRVRAYYNNTRVCIHNT